MVIPLILRQNTTMILKKFSYKLLLLAILFTLITNFLSISFQKINSIFNLQLFDIENIINYVASSSFYCLITIFLIFAFIGINKKDWILIIKAVHVEWALRHYFQSEIQIKINVNLTKNDCFIVIQDFETFEQEKTFVQIETAIRNKIAKLLRQYTLSSNFEYCDNAYRLEGVKIR